MKKQALFSSKDGSEKSIVVCCNFLLGALKTHFSACMRRVAFIITSNKHTLSLFLTSNGFSYLSDYECHKTPTCMKIKGLFMAPADPLSQTTMFQKIVIRL